MKRDVRVLLNNIRSAHNVGSIFRTADALGITHIYISGYTPAPKDRFGRPVKEIEKTALGAEKTISWELEKDPLALVQKLKRDGFCIVGIEQDKRAIDYKTFISPAKILVLVGSEVLGLSQELRDVCDVLIDIPMKGNKESLNVSVAIGVGLFRILEQ